MPVIESKLNTRSEDFAANAAAMQALVDDLRAHCERIAQGGGDAARAKHVARGKLLPRERVERLLDPAEAAHGGRAGLQDLAAGEGGGAAFGQADRVALTVDVERVGVDLVEEQEPRRHRAEADGAVGARENQLPTGKAFRQYRIP